MKKKTFSQVADLKWVIQLFSKKLLLTFFGLCLFLINYAIDYTSNNVTGNWSASASWSPAGVPGAGDNVTISQGTITLDVASAIGNITISGGTLKLNASLTVNGAWALNSGTFTPNTQAVIFATGSSIGGANAATFYNLTINTTNSTDIVPLNKSGIVIANNGTLSVTKGIFKVGAGNIINMGTNGSSNISVAGGTTGNFASAADGSGLNTDADGGTINQVPTSGSTIAITGDAVLYNIWCGGGANGNYKLDLKSAGIRINGTLTVGVSGGNQFQCNTNSPVWGPNSLLYINNNGQGYTPGAPNHLEWVSMSGGTIGSTPGYPNNLTLMNCGTSTSNYNGNQYGVKLAGSWSLHGIFQIGTASSTCFVDMNNGGSGTNNFFCGGLILEAGSKLAGPSASGSFLIKGNWVRKGTYINNSGTVTFDGAGTSATPQSVSTTTGTENSFYNMSVNNGTYVKLNSPVTLPATGVFNLYSGIVETSTANLLSITNTAVTALVGIGSATNYINGPVQRGILAGTNSYSFPVGAGTSYLPFDINLNSAGANTATVQAFNTGSGGSWDGTMSSISTTEYWSLSTASALNSGSVSVTRPTAIAPFVYVAKSNAAAGVYTSLAGTVGTFGISNSNNIGTTSPWFFALGTPPIISTLAATSITTTSATLNGAFNTQGASRTTSFSYGTSTSSGLGTPVTLHSPLTSSVPVADSALITGLTANTLYTYVATDGVNSGTDVTFITAPNSPVIGASTNPVGNGFTANWSAPAEPGTAPYTYTVQVSSDPTFATGVTTQSGISSGSTSFTFTTLSTATVYYVRVEAVNATSNSAWSANSAGIATLVVPSPPCENNTSNDGATTFIGVAPVIDGVVDDVWKNAPANPINVVTLGSNNNTQNWQSLWTADSLYLLVKVTDASLVSQGASLAGSFVIPGVPQSGSGNYYEADGIEFYIDADYSNGTNYDGYNDIQLRFNLGSTVISGQSAGGAAQFVGAAFQRVSPLINWKMQVVPGGYLLEAAIPWGKDAAHPGVFLMPNGTYGTATSGQTVGIDVNINDQDNTGGGRQAQIQWFNSSTDAYLHPNVFSNAGLQVCPVAPVVNNPTKSAITSTSAVLGATVVSSGKDSQLNTSPLTSRGSAYNTALPAVYNALPEGGTAVGVYSAVRTGLAPQTKYYFEGYANNAAGLTGVSAVDSFYTLSELPTVQPELSSQTCSQLKLNWTSINFPPVSQASQTGYILLRREDGTNPSVTGIATRVATKQSDLPAGTTLVATISSGATLTYTDATAVAGTAYNYLLVPFTWDGTATDSTYNYFVTGAPSIAASYTATLSAPTVTTVQPTCSVSTGTITVTAPVTDVTYSFNNGVDFQTSPVSAPLTAGATYDVVVKNTAGCISPVKQVSLNAAPSTPAAPEANAVQPTCAVSTGTITVTSPSTGVTYSFDNGNNFQASATSAPLAAGATYQVVVSSGGCKSAATPIQINAAPVTPGAPSATPVQPTCTVSTGTITVNSPSTGVTYSFDNGATFQASATSAPLAAGATYQVVVKSGACVSTATPIQIAAAPVTPALPTATAVQPTCTVATGTITVTAPALGVTYSFDNGATFQAGATSGNLAGGVTYQVVVKSTGGCLSPAKAVPMSVQPATPVVNAGPASVTAVQNEVISIGDINNSPEAVYTWSPASGIANVSAGATTAQIAEIGTYTYTLTGVLNGCEASDNITINIKSLLKCLDPMKGFTPNNDGFNDKWRVYGDQSCFVKVEVSVYNRWGGQVYHSDKYDNNWDGTYKGNALPDATYYYVIKPTSANGHTQVLTGNVTIMR